MITNSFRKSNPKMTPKNFITPIGKIDYCLIIFSSEIFKYLLDNYRCEEIYHLNDCTGGKSIFKFEYKGKTIAFFNTYIGSAGTGNLIEESCCLINCKNYIMFGFHNISLIGIIMSLSQKNISLRYLINGRTKKIFPNILVYQKGWSLNYSIIISL
jgi:hypothetical protein